MGRTDELFGAYFHQDWSMDAKDWKGIVRAFISDSTADEVASTISELQALLHDVESEEEIERLLYTEFGCYYTPRPDLGGLSVRKWLEEVCEELRQ
jgi:hypothetical protein